MSRRKKITIRDCPPGLVSRMEGYRPPVDFESDGATLAIDILFPFDTRPAAIFHDWGYHLGGTRDTRSEVDRQLYRNLRECRVGPVRAFLWWLAVRLFGWLHFQYGSADERWSDALVAACWLGLLLAMAAAVVWWWAGWGVHPAVKAACVTAICAAATFFFPYLDGEY